MKNRWSNVPLARHVLIAVVCVSCLVGCRSLPVADFSPAQPRLKVLTWNVNCGSERKEAAIRILAESGADVVCLQETDPAWCKALDEALASRYPHRLLLPYAGVAGISVLSRLDFRDTGILAPEAGWFPALWVEVRSPLGPVHVLNVHLRPTLSDRGTVTLPAYFEVPPIRAQEIRGFLQSMPPDRLLVVAGDFNEGDGGRAVDWLRGEGFTDALSCFDRGSSTWRYQVGPVPISGRFDHVLVRRPLTTSGAQVLESDVNDHRPVLAVVLQESVAGR